MWGAKYTWHRCHYKVGKTKNMIKINVLAYRPMLSCQHNPEHIHHPWKRSPEEKTSQSVPTINHLEQKRDEICAVHWYYGVEYYCEIMSIAEGSDRSMLKKTLYPVFHLQFVKETWKIIIMTPFLKMLQSRRSNLFWKWEHRYYLTRRVTHVTKSLFQLIIT